jgi:hypothetical protein
VSRPSLVPSSRPARARRLSAARAAVLVALLAVALAAAVATVGQLDSTRAGAQAAPVCVTARNSDHVAAGRAYRLVFTVWARGSNDALGLSTATTTLLQESAGV